MPPSYLASTRKTWKDNRFVLFLWQVAFLFWLLVDFDSYCIFSVVSDGIFSVKPPNNERKRQQKIIAAAMKPVRRDSRWHPISNRKNSIHHAMYVVLWVIITAITVVSSTIRAHNSTQVCGIIEITLRHPSRSSLRNNNNNNNKNGILTFLHYFFFLRLYSLFVSISNNILSILQPQKDCVTKVHTAKRISCYSIHINSGYINSSNKNK
jgi:hypothetical protein